MSPVAPTVKSQKEVEKPEEDADGPASSAGQVYELAPFAWPAVKKTQYYRVELRRAGRRIFRARTARPRLRIPPTWTYVRNRYGLTTGRYRWRVVAYSRPVTHEGARAREIVDATLVIPRSAK